MNSLLAQLFALTGALNAAEGVDPAALDALRQLLAACLVQQDPGLLPVVPDPQFSAALNEAAVAGAALAAERSAAGVRLRFVKAPYLDATNDPGRPIQTFGPWVDEAATLQQFSIFETTTFRSVMVEADLLFFAVHVLLMRLPADSAIDADLQVVTIPPGTVWLQASRLVANAPGYVLLRVSGGSLQLDQPARIAPDGHLQLALGGGWTLRLQPEPAPAATAEGSDANAVSLSLPSAFELSANGDVLLTGAIGWDGLGSALRFDTPQGAAVLADQAIAFPYAPGENVWALAGNRSALAQFNGESTVTLALWALPLTLISPDDAFEAAHGGLVAVLFSGAVGSSVTGLGGPGWPDGRLKWTDLRLTASAQGIALNCRSAEASLRTTLALWDVARSDLDFDGVLQSIRFVSRRDGADLLAWAGGRLRSRWDLPRDASGVPFAFGGLISAFSSIAEAQGLRRIAVVAAQPEPNELHGLALENLYLSVSPVRQLAFAGSGAAPGLQSSGKARLLFDVSLGEPMLPDPYVANWTPFLQAQQLPPPTPDALSVTMRWQAEATPALQWRLAQRIRFPEPRDIAVESDLRLGEMFRAQLQAQSEFLNLLDLSTHDHHFGVALESLSDQRLTIDTANRLNVELRNVRLLMQPQVHWEPVQVIDKDGQPGAVLRSQTQGGHSLVGALTVTLVPVLPSAVGRAIIDVANGQRPAAALFSLPFGLRAFVHMDASRRLPLARPPVSLRLHEPQFDAGMTGAQQLRLRARGRTLPRGMLALADQDPSRSMPGAMHQTTNLDVGGGPPGSVLPVEIAEMLNFDTFVPLHGADLSGYGLSCFSRWRRDAPAPAVATFGVTKVQLDVLSGRTSYEVIEVRSVLAPCQCQVVRTIVFERRNSGRVQRMDSGWQAIDDGLFAPFVAFETGVLRALRNIRRIRILPEPELTLNDAAASHWQPVIFDADAEIDDLVLGGKGGRVPALDHRGYIQLAPVWNSKIAPALQHEAPDAARFAALFKAVGGTIGGPVDCHIRVGGTLDMHLQSLLAGLAPDDAGQPGFVVAAYGAPTLPRAGQWSAVRIDGATSDVSALDPRHGLPLIQRTGQAYRFRDPVDARLTARQPLAEYGLLMSTPSARVLFAKPTVGPARAGPLSSAPPLLADPSCLLQASGAFPRAAFALAAKELPSFSISEASAWTLSNPDFTFTPPLPAVASGAAWDLQRRFLPDANGLMPPFHLGIDSTLPDAPWNLAQPVHKFELNIPPFGTIFSIDCSLEALARRAANLVKPKLLFGPILDALQDMVNALRAMADLPAGLDIDVDVSAREGANPAFIVRLNLKFSIGGGPDGRVDIGLGKFYGVFELDGEFEAALNGDTHGRLSLSFQGDIQQAIIPPLIYAGGMFRFALEVKDGGTPVIELGLGTATSIGGDLIPGVIALEATLSYGYMLIPQRLKPGVMLSIDARAKLLGGLLGMSFSAQALARIERLNADKTVTIFADIRVAGSVQVAIFLKEKFDFHTKFEQNLPLAPLLIVAGANPLLAAATLVVL